MSVQARKNIAASGPQHPVPELGQPRRPAHRRDRGAGPVPRPDAGEPAPARLEAALQEIAAALTATSWGWIFPAALAATDASPALAAGYRAFMATLRAAFTTIIADGKKAGELPSVLDEEDFTDALLGPLLFRRLIRKLPADPAWVRHHLQRTLSTYSVSPSGGSPPHRPQ
jgi:tetracycline repressor-like protein